MWLGPLSFSAHKYLGLLYSMMTGCPCKGPKRTGQQYANASTNQASVLLATGNLMSEPGVSVGGAHISVYVPAGSSLSGTTNVNSLPQCFIQNL